MNYLVVKSKGWLLLELLSVSPKILVLDEPTSALDVLVQSTVIDLLHRLRREFDLTYVFISHDLSLMRNRGNRRGGHAARNCGRDCERRADIFDAPAHAYTRALLSAIPVVSAGEEALKPKIKKQERDEVLATSSVLEV